MQVEQYRLKHEAYHLSRRTRFRAAIFLIVISVLCFGLMNFSDAPVHFSDEIKFGLFLIAMNILVVADVSRITKKKKNAYENFLLTIDDDAIMCKQSESLSFEITQTEITEIVKNTDGSFTLHAGVMNAVFTIPPGINQPLQLEERLNQISPVLIQKKNSIRRYIGILIVLAIVLIFFSTDNKMVVCIAAAILLLLLLRKFFISGKRSAKTG